MNEEEKLKIYLHRINLLAKENIKKKDTSALEAIREAINFVESEMTGY